ncbi:MAG: GntR family transcriptional regulator [Acetatifactor sp.]|nr:GntR family transcriptional regulator [Acetatifactor sp.]
MIVLDYRDKRPLYEQVTEKLAHLIIRGALAPGEKMPSVRQLALELSVNPNTIQRAYAQLEQDGYLYSVVGKGNFVSETFEWKIGKLKELKKELTALISQAQTAGMTKEDIIALISDIYSRADHKEELT